MFFLSCSLHRDKISFFEIVPAAKGHAASVFIFFSPDCPLSQNYSLPVKNLSEEFVGNNIGFYAVFPGKLYSREEIISFLQEYDINTATIFDEEKDLTHYLGATVTPQVFVLDSTGKILYGGAIDDGYAEVGKKRQVITQYYLRNALEAFLQNKPVKIPLTKAVGCIIE